MSKRRTGRIVFTIGFVVLLLDGAAAVWLGQISGRRLLVYVGLALIAAAAGLVLAYRRWQDALAEVDEARNDLRLEIGKLRAAADRARGRKPLS